MNVRKSPLGVGGIRYNLEGTEAELRAIAYAISRARSDEQGEGSYDGRVGDVPFIVHVKELSEEASAIADIVDNSGPRPKIGPVSGVALLDALEVPEGYAVLSFELTVDPDTKELSQTVRCGRIHAGDGRS